ncbi:MAG: PEGA domain-containing protein [Acidobacteriota bacterium]|nr:PEGA domain-containing protein [Acidobacteriota bacterium]
MKLRFLILFVVLAAVQLLALPQQPQGPLTQNQVTDLVKYGVNSTDLVEKIRKLGIDFDPNDQYLQVLRKAGAKDEVIQALRAARKPISRDQIGKLVAGGVSSQRAVSLVKQRGIDFQADEQYLQTLRLAGADDTLIAALREASAAATGQLVVETSPNAEVRLDGEPQGHADARGELALRTKLGAHTLQVSLEGKKDYQQIVTVTGEKECRFKARLEDTASATVRENPGYGVEDGTPVKLRLTRTLSSADAQVNDRVDFEVLEEVKSGGIVIIPKGGIAWGTVTDAQPKRRMGRAGKLDIRIDNVRLVDGEKAPLRAVKESKGQDKKGTMTTGLVATGIIFFPAAPLFLLKHGEDITIPKDTQITAYINGDFKLGAAKARNSVAQ